VVAAYAADVSERKDLVGRYFDGFRRSDHDAILACLTDDVAWDLPGHAHFVGKAEFDAEIERPGFEGSPTLDVDRLIEEADTIVAIGEGRGAQAGGEPFGFAFCTVFTFSGDLIARVESYVVPL
jgi:ketosteroid isomerase-like protein